MNVKKVRKTLSFVIGCILVALLGGIVNMLGWTYSSRALAISGFALAAVAIVVGGIGVLIGQFNVIKRDGARERADRD